MKTKFILTDKKTGTTYKYKTLKDVAESIDIDYHRARSIYIFYTKGKKHTFPITKQLCDRYELRDDEDYLNVLKD
jgi:hypothetical protein